MLPLSAFAPAPVLNSFSLSLCLYKSMVKAIYGGDEPSKQVQVQMQVNAILARFKHSHQVRPYHDIYICGLSKTFYLPVSLFKYI